VADWSKGATRLSCKMGDNTVKRRMITHVSIAPRFKNVRREAVIINLRTTIAQGPDV
jgi:hypothetical protein